MTATNSHLDTLNTYLQQLTDAVKQAWNQELTKAKGEAAGGTAARAKWKIDKGVEDYRNRVLPSVPDIRTNKWARDAINTVFQREQGIYKNRLSQAGGSQQEYLGMQAQWDEWYQAFKTIIANPNLVPRLAGMPADRAEMLLEQLVQLQIKANKQRRQSIHIEVPRTSTRAEIVAAAEAPGPGAYGSVP